MSLPAAPPARSVATLPVREGSSGWQVFALQSALNDAAGATVGSDGVFGPATDAALRRAQATAKLSVDGVCGPKTWSALTLRVCRRIHRELPDLQAGLARGFAHGEGGDHGAAVNWSAAGGVDCGLFQRRVLGPPFSPDGLRLAFAPVRGGIASMMVLLSRAKAFARVHPRSPFSPIELAILSHNWPYAADQYFRYGKLPTPSKPAPWVPASLPASAKTYDGWARFYVRSITGG